MPSTKNPSPKTIFWTILVLALLVRTWGIKWGLPFTYHIDENWFYGKSKQFLETGDLNPRFWHVPTFHMYLVAAVWEGYYFAGKAVGHFSTRKEFLDTFNQDPSRYYFMGRIITVLLSVGAILSIFSIGKRMYGLGAGALAAAMLIFSSEHNKISHYMVPDSLLASFQIFSFYFIWRIYEEGKTKFYLLSGLFAGLAFGTKYGGQFLVLPLLLAHVFRQRENKVSWPRIIFNPKLIVWGLMFILVFVASSPYAVLDFKAFKAGFQWQSVHLLSEGHFGSSTAQPAWLFYLQYGFYENAGLLAQFLVLGAVIAAVVRRRRKDWIVLAMPLVMFLLIGTWQTRGVRYLLPLAPFFLLAAGDFLGEFSLKFRSLLAKGGGFVSRKGAGITAGLIAVFLAPSVFKTLRYDYVVSGEDTRTTAKHWIDAHIPPGTKIALESYCPPISMKRYKRYTFHNLSRLESVDWLVKRKIKFAIIGDTMYARFTRFPKEFPEHAAFYGELDEKGVLIKTFKPRWDEDLLDEHNPTVKIFRLGNSPDLAFPGHFSRYSQSVTLTRKGAGWAVESALLAEPMKIKDEKIKSLYVRITDKSGKETGRLILHQGEIPASGEISFNGALDSGYLPAGGSVFIGYEFEFTSGLSPDPSLGGPKKERAVIKNIGPEIAAQGPITAYFLYTGFPNARGDDYFQNVSLIRAGGRWTVASEAYGGELHFGDDNVTNPFVRIAGPDGREISTLFLFQGKMGSYDTQEKGPVIKSASLSDLPSGFKVFAGYEFYFDKEQPGKAGGPEAIELKLPLPVFE